MRMRDKDGLEACQHLIAARMGVMESHRFIGRAMDTIDTLHARIDELERELAAMRPVVEAAMEAWDRDEIHRNAHAACLAYRAQQKEADHD